LALALVVSAAGMVSAVLAIQQPPGPVPQVSAIRLRAATFSPARGEAPPVPADQLSVPTPAGQRGEYLVQFQGPVLDDWKAALVTAGVDFLEYVPDFAFHVRMTPELAANLRQLPFVAWVGPYHPAYRLTTPSRGAEVQPYVVRLERDADAAVVETALGATGIRATRRGASLLLVTAQPSQLATIAQTAGVASIEPYALRVKHNEFGGGVILGSRVANDSGFDGSSQVVAVADTGLGTGTAIGAHADIPAARVRSIVNRPGIPDFCFETIVDDGAADVDTGHGTHVATAVLGAGNALGVGRGTAPASSLVFQAVENYAIPSLLCSLLYGVPEGYYLVGLPGDLGDLYQEAYEAGARVHSNSWGSAVDGVYTADAESTDAFVWAHRDMAVAFSAGNSGVDANGDGVVDAMSVGSPATAKNVITVGASENDRQSHWECDSSLGYTNCAAQDGQNATFAYGATWPDSFPANPLRDDPSAGNAEQMAAFSSRGPTTDGRIKPDVVAPGTWTLSGYADLYQQQYDTEPNPQNGSYQYDGWGFPVDASYKYMGGTSMAAPLVAGGAAVVRDFYQKARSHQASAALVKATLINSAVDLLDENNDGLLDNALPIPNIHEGWGRVDLGNATDGTHHDADEATPLATGATASYTFAVADAGHPFKATLTWTDYPSSPTAAANLVNDLDLTVVAPDGTTYFGNAFTGGWSIVGGTPDRVNNVENVFVPAAATGTWTVIVGGYNVPMGPQRFALVVDLGPQPGSSLPVVRASAVDPSATEVGPTAGVVRFTRTGDTSSALTVNYAVTGTATAEQDYAGLSGSVTIAEGASEASVTVDAIDDDIVEPVERVVVTLSSDASYKVGSPSSAMVSIESEDLPPDLAVSAIKVPAWAAAGAPIDVTDTTINPGTVPAPSSETGFYLSTNSTLEASDVFLGLRVVSALGPQASQAGTSALLIPEATGAGAYYIVAKADWADQVDEASESNNTRTSSLVRVGPDLSVSSLSAPSTAAAGGVVQVADTTKNLGVAASPVSVTAFYLSTNGSWDVGDVRLGSRTVASLAGGAASAATTALTIPAPTSVGTYYLFARADDDGTVAEVAENNNLRSSTVRVGPDLAVTAVTGPAAAEAGDAITVTDTTTNTGGAAASASTTEYFLSPNTSFSVTDVRLGERVVPALGTGASHTASVTLTIPAGTAMGTYYVLARADGPNDVIETSETNNVRASGAVKMGPDLIVLSLVAPSSGSAGGTLSVTETVKNQGGAPSAATESVFYLSSNTALDAGDIELGRRNVPALNASATAVATVSLLLPSSLAVGNYYVLSQVDPANVVPELLESNNGKASTVVRVGPDLVVTALTGPSSAVQGTSVVVTDTTRNQGGGAAEPSVTRFYLSSNGALDSTDVLLGGRTVVGLSAGATSVVSTALTIPPGTAAGSYYVIAAADDERTVAETIETNNTRSLYLRVNP
jgi:subtilase family serine protease